MKKTTGLMILVLISILVAGCNTQESQTIKVGFISPLTTGASVIGIQQMNSVKLAVDEINNAGGINGKALKVIYEDSKCDGKEAANAVSKLVSVDNVRVLLGDICSAGAIASKPITEENQVFMFTWGSSPEITANSKYIARNSPADDAAGEELGQYIFNHGTENLAVIILNNDFTSALADSTRAEFESLGGRIAIFESLDPSTEDFRTPISKIKESDADAILLLGTAIADSGKIVKQIREQGLDQQLYSAYAFGSPVAIEAAGADNVKGLIYLDAPELDKDNRASSDFLAKYEEAYSTEPLGSKFYAAAAYDSVYILKNALEACGQDSACIKKEITGMQFDGVLGTYSFKDSGDVQGIGFSFNTVGEE